MFMGVIGVLLVLQASQAFLLALSDVSLDRELRQEVGLISSGVSIVAGASLGGVLLLGFYRLY